LSASVWTTEPADTQAPSIVTNLAVSNRTANSITLTWTTNNVAVTGYDVYVDRIKAAGLTTTN
jgi:hypothetical protein